MIPGEPRVRQIVLPERGRTLVWEQAGPAGAPTLLLLHGLGSTAVGNWATSLPSLGREFGVVALDQRGHGRGLPLSGRLRIDELADDAAALLDELRVPRAIAVGYSMGGFVAQRLWRRHPGRISGVVLCATADRLGGVLRVTQLAAAVVVTTRDRLIPPGVQRALARRIDGATVHEVDAGHLAPATDPGRFVPALLTACRSVARRAQAGPAAA